MTPVNQSITVPQPASQWKMRVNVGAEHVVIPEQDAEQFPSRERLQQAWERSDKSWVAEWVGQDDTDVAQGDC